MRKNMRGGRLMNPRDSLLMNPREMSNVMNRPSVPTSLSTWERIKKFAKDNKVLSRGIKSIGTMVGDKYKPFFNAGSDLASHYGFGRKRRRGRGQRGGAINRIVRF